ncbi:DUF4012 domain-containing protein [Myceligenerans pegani]|uniref:DUF4012 domain-containing protein n=1 Tax=Myceligenerans pegani TaxID=2776917 RepID=A0ABR9MV09_9MICO|nr:DUF4012 domain-containing protein [Myceligenerans sp. TRM 65318]MBE1875221.1 DUF4012 domain-containing protein [Myceligenerans sp. TRM 65318]MBE3017492.1 DUF4012 domain-containing protein [Myceligenerans sp. TRM 65318]
MTHPGWGDKWAGAPQFTAQPARRSGSELLERAPELPDGAPARPPRRREPFWNGRRRRALRIVLWAAVVALLLLAVTVGWAAVDALRARAALSDAAAGVTALREDVLAGDTDGLEARLSGIQEDARRAHDATRGPHWSVARELPGTGPTAEAIATMSEVVDELARGALPDLARSAELVDPGTFAPRDGRIDLEPLRKVAPDVVRADRSVELAAERVGRLDGAMLPQVTAAVAELRAQIDGLRSTTATAARAADVLPPLLGAEGPRDYLVLVQNPAEPRALGGIAGTVLLLRAVDGTVTLADQLPGGTLGPYDEPVLPLTPDERSVLGAGGEVGRWMQNVTMTPDFPRTAELARTMWMRETGQRVDGVLTTDPVTLAALLRGTGPVEIAEGRRVAPDELADYLLHDVYFEHEEPRAQDMIFAHVAKQAFDRLSDPREGGEADMIAALAESARQGRLLVWSSDDAVNRRLAGTVLDGSLTGVRGDSPVVGVFTQGINMAKIAYYLDTEVDVAVVAERRDGSRELDVTVTYTSRVPEGGAGVMPEYFVGYGEKNPGEIRLRSLVYAPAGGWVAGAYSGDQEIGLTPKKQGEFSVASRDIELSPGATVSVTYAMITGKRQSGDIILRVTPGPRPADITISDDLLGRAE